MEPTNKSKEDPKRCDQDSEYRYKAFQNSLDVLSRMIINAYRLAGPNAYKDVLLDSLQTGCRAYAGINSNQPVALSDFLHFAWQKLSTNVSLPSVADDTAWHTLNGAEIPYSTLESLCKQKTRIFGGPLGPEDRPCVDRLYEWLGQRTRQPPGGEPRKKPHEVTLQCPEGLPVFLDSLKFPPSDGTAGNGHKRCHGQLNPDTPLKRARLEIKGDDPVANRTQQYDEPFGESKDKFQKADNTIATQSVRLNEGEGGPNDATELDGTLNTMNRTSFDPSEAILAVSTRAETLIDRTMGQSRRDVDFPGVQKLLEEKDAEVEKLKRVICMLAS